MAEMSGDEQVRRRAAAATTLAMKYTAEGMGLLASIAHEELAAAEAWVLTQVEYEPFMAREVFLAAFGQGFREGREMLRVARAAQASAVVA